MSVDLQLKQFGLPAGRYPATVTAVDMLEPERARRRPWRLRVVARVERNGRDVTVFRPLGDTDPYEMSPGLRKSLRSFAVRFGWAANGAAPVEELVAFVRGAVGREVVAHVRPGLMGLAVSFYGTTETDERVVAGEVLDRLPSVEPELRAKTEVAQGAHQQLVAGLHHAHRGFALAAEACWRLRQDEGWVALGHDSVGAYLASPELSMSRAQFYKLADIWQTYVEDGGVEEQRLCAPSKLEVPLAALHAGDVSAEEALADAEELGLRDLRAKYRPGEGGAREAGTDGRADPGASGRPSFPFGCRACGVVIEGPDQVEADGVVYRGHRWPAGWSSEQVMAAVAAAEGVS